MTHHAYPIVTRLTGECGNCGTELVRIVGPYTDYLTEECTGCETATFRHVPHSTVD